MAPNDDFLNDVRPNRRGFVKGVVGTTAFAAPFVASFDLQSLSSSAANAAAPANQVSSNQTVQLP
jgi:hypothetical protein